jgi:signal transduction histidine kinase/PAS domain-containing protein
VKRSSTQSTPGSPGAPAGASTPPDGSPNPNGHAPGEPDLAAVFAALPRASAVLAADPPRFTVVAVNDAALAIVRRPRDDVVGRALEELFPGGGLGGSGRSDLTSVREALHAAIRTRAPQRVSRHRHDLARSDGQVEERYWDALSTPVVDPDGVVRHVILQADDVSARVRAEAALNESEERYRTLFESIDEGLCVVEVLLDERGRPADYRWIQTNPAFVQQTGLVGAVGHTAREMVPGLEERWIETYGRVALTGQPVRFQDHSEPMGRWFDVYAFRLGRPEQRRVAILFTDITAMRRAEREREQLLRALEIEQHRLTYLFQHAPTFLAVLRGPDHVFELVNEGYRQLVGHRPLVGRAALEALPEVSDQGFKELLDRVLITGAQYVGREVPVLLARTPDAPPEERFLDFVYLPITEPDGTRTGVIAHGTDVTEQVVARREVERARDRADRLQSLTAALAATTTPEEVAEVVVAQGVEATGAATGMLALRDHGEGAGTAMMLRQIGLTPRLVTLYSRFPLTAPGPAATCLRTGEAFFLESRETLMARFPELAEAWRSLGTLSLATVPLTVAGATIGVMSFTWRATRVLPDEDREFFLALGGQAAQALERARLLAAERAARAEAEAARAEAEAANRAKSEFLAVMSHELRTPLNAIGGYAELMEMGIRGPVNDQQREDLRRIQGSQRHLLGLINEVLNYARLETGSVRYDLSAVLVCDALAEAEGLVAPQARAKGLRLGAARCPEELVVRADAEKLRQILVNLLSNAVKFTDPDGHIELTAAPDEDRVRIEVRDTGIGIPAEKLEEIFEPFVQVRTGLTRTAEGAGLGLAISRDLARGMAGDLTARSTLGAGSTFTLTLPRA